ncbi:serine/threonine-protein kinase [Anaeromyxobacter diazotrophicus]|uniref:Protein kinase domain-containing protein n=1 Tax=Anaeromyxobacter diazotrophicus TaxID=2590199 RepID=A0A7I9VK11_9BACT|nr:serine/threonine-protein kinase [Anaeromyxobacter diazotrophicus]GEJ56705.1 hypothetical protein AMYX_14460 [Anaeromyxobacter diazotrophicus]
MPDANAREPSDLAKLVGTRLGNYRLERLVGRGRMGAVYLAQDEALLRPTAVKVLAWSAAEARGHDPVKWFLAEARLVARINHPRVVQIYGAARQGDRCYIAMEYVAGASAEALVAECGALPPARATDLLVQAAAALEAAHRCGVVHRDVKPANLLIGPEGSVKLGDFGMALGSAGIRTAHAHLRVGTPYYTAPEIWRGEAATPASDLYSLGATYFQLLTGRPPYPAHDVAAVEQAHLGAAVPDPRELVPGLPAACAALAMRALAKSPRERPASAEALGKEARRVLRELAAAPPPPPEPARAAAPPRATAAPVRTAPRPAAGAATGRTGGRGEGVMTLLATISSLPEVKGAVLGTSAGAFVDTAGEADGEAVAAVMGFMWTALSEAGEQLGLGALGRISLSGATGACVATAEPDGTVLSALVEPAGSLVAVEKVLDDALSRNGA